MNTILMFRRFTTARMILLGSLCVLLAAFVSIHPAFGQLTDTTPPVLKSFDFTPKSVDVTSGDATVTVNLHVTDDLSGFSFASVYFYNPSRGHTGMSMPT